jgi:hypothetical protein
MSWCDRARIYALVHCDAQAGLLRYGDERSL